LVPCVLAAAVEEVSADPTLLVPTVRCLSGAAVFSWLLVLSCSSSWLPTDASEMVDPELPLRVMLYGSYMRKERMGVDWHQILILID